MAKKSNDITLQEIGKIVQDTSSIKVIQSLLDKGLIHVYETLHDHYLPKKETLVCIHSEYEKEESQKELFKQLERAPKQLDILLTFLHRKFQGDIVSKQELLNVSKADTSALNALIKKKYTLHERSRGGENGLRI